MSRRTRAAIAAGLLAFSTAGVPAAAAQEPDEVSEGTAEVVENSAEPGSDVDLELGADAVRLADEAPSTPDAASAPAYGDDGPLEQDLATEIQGSGVDTTDDASAVAPDEAAPSVEPESPAPAPAETPAPAPAAAEEVRADVAPVALAPERRQKPKAAEESRPRSKPAEAPAPAPAVVEPVRAAEPVAAPVAAETATPPPAETIRVSSGSRVGSGDRFHVVRSGESLWSIASGLLGERATVAQIAREVNRLWELNDERIGTGRPDLLFAGTRLRLR